MLPGDHDGAPGSSHGIASQVMFWLDEHYREKFRLDALAEELGKSRSYVSRKFHAETGEKIHDYLNTIRLRKACECLLHTDASVREIAEQVGFSDVTWFISAFRKGIGETPLQYRKNHADR
jgi:AraC-like DNA-binding protein